MKAMGEEMCVGVKSAKDWKPTHGHRLDNMRPTHTTVKIINLKI